MLPFGREPTYLRMSGRISGAVHILEEIPVDALESCKVGFFEGLLADHEHARAVVEGLVEFLLELVAGLVLEVGEDGLKL